MTTSTFDSLAAMRALEAAGVDRKHAEAHAEQLRAAAGADLEQLVTRADLNRVETALTADLKRVETTLTAEMRIVKWAMAFQGAVSLATLAAVLGLAWKLLP